MRVGIANDLRIATETLRRVVTSRPDLSVAWTAVDGRDAVERCRADRPDVILMDMIMPVMDGVEATRQIMRETPCPIIVVTATVEGNASRVYDALGHGALDAVNTPTVGPRGNLEGGAELLRKIDLVRMLQRATSAKEPETTAPQPTAERSTRPPILAVGASTGGPQAVAEVLSALPKPWAYPIVVVQHVGIEFVPGLAEWLTRQTGLNAAVAAPGAPPAAGAISVAGRDAHLVVDRSGRLAYADEPRDHLHRPSVDVLFHSLAASGDRGVALLLTGMGRDGAQGLLALKRAGWWTIAQDKESSVVWGMPGEAVRIGAASETRPIEEIAVAAAAAMESQRVGTARPAAPNRHRRELNGGHRGP